MNKYFNFNFYLILPALLLLTPYLPKAQNIDGVWKSAYSKTVTKNDSTLALTKILLNINNGDFTLANYDDLFIEKEPFVSSGNVEEGFLVFNRDSVNEKRFPYLIDNQKHLIVKSGYNYETETIYAKLQKHNLARFKDSLRQLFVENHYVFDFSYFDQPIEIEFEAGGKFTVVNSVVPYFPVYSMWDAVTFDNELFVYFSGLAPFVQITFFSDTLLECTDETDKVYKGTFTKKEISVKFDKKLLYGIWKQKKAGDFIFKKIPQSLRDKDFYPEQVYVFEDSIVKKYDGFRMTESPWEISHTGEMISFPAFGGDSYRHFRVISLGKDMLVVERYYGQSGVQQDTLLRMKKLPKPVTLNKYLEKR